jgi:hypothetical protein
MKTKDEIKIKVEKLKKEKKVWDDQMKDVISGNMPNMNPYTDMVGRHIAMYGYQIEVLIWCIEE